MGKQESIPSGDWMMLAEYARTRDRGLRDRIVESHLGLAQKMAHRFTNRGEPYDDLVQVASLALVKALDRFDPDRGVEFTTFAVTSMLGELKRHFRDRGWAIKAPRRIQELYLELGSHIENLSQELRRAPTVAELAQASGAAEGDVLEAMEAGRGYRTSSLDVPDAEGQSLAESIGELDQNLAGFDDKSILAEALCQLSKKEQTLVRLRFVDGLTQSQIASRFGVSQMQISRLLASCVERLRHSFVENHAANKG